jgi:acetyl esterase/lipase
MRRHLVALTSVGVALLASGCVQYIAPAGPAPLRYRDQIFSGFTKTSDITYGSAVDAGGNTVTLKLDTYAPTGDTVTKRPAIVWVHGGSFCCGSKTSPEIVDEAQTFARKGFFNVSINYRLEPDGCSASAPTSSCVTAIQEAMTDAETAVRWLRANASTYGVDTNRIAIAGSSAGAITALNVGYHANDDGVPAGATVRAAVSLSGARIFGTVEPDDAPALLLHGTEDRLVPYQWAVNTVNAAADAGVAAYLTTWEGLGHVPYVERHDEIHNHTTNFLYSVLDLAHAAR